MNCFVPRLKLYEQLERTEVKLAVLAKEVTDAVTHVVAGVLF